MGQKCGCGRSARRIKAAKRSEARVKRRKRRGEMLGGGGVDNGEEGRFTGKIRHLWHEQPVVLSKYQLTDKFTTTFDVS